jgi:hypothetical protein
MEERAKQFGAWMEPFATLRIPLVFDLRMDPFECAQTDAKTYTEWMERMIQWVGMPAVGRVTQMVGTLKAFPPRPRPASFNVEQIMQQLTASPVPGK